MQLRTLSIAAVLVGATAAAAWWTLHDRDPIRSWRLEAVTQTDVRATVSATGTLEAATTVEVGTQVSGTLEAVLVDFNDRVEAGQVIARIDPSVLEADVQGARANLAVREAELSQATQELARTEALYAQQVAATQELEADRNSHAVAAAQLQAARVSLRRAQQNLAYATITSPVTGTVIERAVDQGQTVNAGMTAPTLFLIAGDLTRMQILASVDEADIGRIAAGQAVDFTVQAYDRDHFAGTVRQVRLQSTSLENVVTYSVVVDVDNSDGRLLPGMTATVDFIVAEAKDVLCVPNAALRYRPDDSLVLLTPSGDAAAGDEKKSGKGAGRGNGGRRGGSMGASSTGRLWLPAVGGKLSALVVQTGLSDGSCTEVSGEGVTADMEVVAGVISGAAADDGSSSPFQQQQSRRRPGGF